MDKYESRFFSTIDIIIIFNYILVWCLLHRIMNYYKDLWTKPGQEGTKFFYNVDFNHHYYRLQEHIFREFLKSLKRLVEQELDGSSVQPPFKNILEVGVGTGRITRIVWEELSPDIKWYYGTDINIPDKLEERFDNRYGNNDMKFQLGWFDITDDEFYIQQRDLKYDLIIASEIFMHIKPDDMGPVITKLSKLLAPDHGLLVNIDWYHMPEKSDWFFIHDYDKLYTTNGLTPIYTRDLIEIKQKLFCYGR